jgi:DNA-directed RNA polymerase I, II, and III subunit RPABC4
MEEYTPPTFDNQNVGQAINGPVSSDSTMVYICGQCGIDNDVRPKDPIRCSSCGYRIMYKKRSKKVVQYEAR